MHNCDLCHAGPDLAYRLDQGAVVCWQCGFVYVPERRTPEEIAKAWDDLWEQSYTSEWPAVKARLFYVAEYLDQLIGLKRKNVLDIGAGEGTFLKYVWERGAIRTAVEPDPKNCRKMAVQGIPYFNGPIEQFETEQRYDVVTLNWTLENTGDCIGVLKKARELLKPGGHICVATGSRILVPFKKPYSSYFSDNPPDLHCFRWSENSLARALINSGFGPPTFNDYAVNDWMVAIAQPDDPPPACFQPKQDSPHEVLKFFKDWKETWP